MDIREVITALDDFFEGEYYFIGKIVSKDVVKGQKQLEECQPAFEHCFVYQHGPSFGGDEYHGLVYFYIEDGDYLAVEY